MQRPRWQRPRSAHWLTLLLLFLLWSACRAADREVMHDATAVLEGRLFDAVAGEMIEDGVVVLAGARIACAGAREGCRWPEDAPAHRYDGATILPGLIDLHAHIRRQFIMGYVPAGVTTVRDVSNTVETIRTARDVDGAPRIIAAGAELDGPESFLAPVSETAARALQAATWHAARILGREGIGRLEAGTHADVLVVRGDPLEDVRRTRDVVAVWQTGQPVDLEAAWERVRADLEAVDGPMWHPAQR